jgi:4-amino-4-deoxy-L-arabinose transferase-like glycosyltransferase
MAVLKSAFKNHSGNIAVLLLVFFGCVYMVFPTDDFPLNDDWSYAHSVKYLHETGIIDIGYWPAMSLVAHILWGNVFVSLFGFSHFVLRCSTLFLAALTLILFYKLIFAICKQYRSALLLTLFLAFNPLWFLLANSFMTDVPFLFSLVLAFYSLERVVVQQKNAYIIVFSFACVHAILIRQFGLALPVSLFMLACVYLVAEKKRRRQAWLFLIPVLISVVTYFVFEKWVVNHLPPGSSYQSAGAVTKDHMALFLTFFENLIPRFSNSMLYIGLFLCPLSVMAALNQVRTRSWGQVLLILIPSAIVAFFALSRIGRFPVGNCFYNCGLGVRSVYDVTVLEINTTHAFSNAFEPLVKFLAAVGAIGLSICVVSGIATTVGRFRKKEPVNKLKLFLVFFSIIYFLILCVSSCFFDRYSLPLVASALLLCAGYIKEVRPAIVTIGIFVVAMAAFTFTATRDYFVWNRSRWELINTSIERGTESSQINGGFEYVAFTFYDKPWWGLWIGPDARYKVSCGPLPNHELVKGIGYQRYIPYQKDSLFLYRKK